MVRPWCLGGGRQTQHWRLNRWRPNPCFPPWASGADPHRVPRHRSGSRRARRLHNEDRAGRMAQDVAAGTAARRPSPPLIRADHDRMCSGCRSHLQDGRCRIAHHDATLRSNPTPHGRGGSWPAVAVRIGRRGWSRAGGWPRSAGSPRPSPPARWHAPRRGEPPRSGRWPAAAGGPGGRRAASNRCGAVPSHAPMPRPATARCRPPEPQLRASGLTAPRTGRRCVAASPRASAKPGWSWNAGSGATGVAAPDRRSGQPPIATAPLTSLAPQASSHSRSRLGGFSSTLRGPITAPERVRGRSPLQR